MRPYKYFQLAKELACSFEPKEVVVRGGRIARNIIFRGPLYDIPDIIVKNLEARIDSLFPGSTTDIIMQAIRSEAVISGREREAFVQKMRDGDLRFLGDADLKFENCCVTWNQIPGCIPWPKIPSWEISFRQKANVHGDVKRIWNLSKHPQWVLLACNGQDESSADDIDYLFTEWGNWLDENPLGIGINWTSALEVAERAINWLICLCMLKDQFKYRREILNRITEGLLGHGVFLAKRLTTWSYNHCIGESTALIMLANLFTGYPFAEKWKRRASTILRQRVDKMVSEEGYYREKSPAYSLLVAQYLALATQLLDPKEGQFVRKRVYNLIASLRKMANMNGKLPNFGDDDSASIINYKFSNKVDVFNHPLLQMLTSECSEMTSAPKRTESHVSKFDIAVLREGLYEAAFNLNNAPIFANVAPHIHDDVLHVCLSHDGVPVVIDSGTFSYSSDKIKRNWYRSAAAHNRPRNACIPESVQSGLFRWRSIVRGAGSSFRDYGGFSLTGATTDPGDVLRYVLLNREYFLVFDRIPSTGCLSTTTTTFCFGKSEFIQQSEAGSYLVSGLFGNAIVGCSILGNAKSIKYNWHKQSFSEHYGSEDLGNAISGSFRASESVWSVWLISVVKSSEEIILRNDKENKMRCRVMDQKGNMRVTVTRERNELNVEIIELNGTILLQLPQSSQP